MSEPAAVVVEGPIITSENQPIVVEEEATALLSASSNPENTSVPALIGNKRKKVYRKMSKEENISASSTEEQIFFKGITTSAPPVIERTDRVSLQTLLPACKRKKRPLVEVDDVDDDNNEDSITVLITGAFDSSPGVLSDLEILSLITFYNEILNALQTLPHVSDD